uniref:non-specific serine/threonine protein kinase n=1 Tax=Oryza nivara TaxID=4536 RepID=A0A0E0IGG4_ORYNI
MAPAILNLSSSSSFSPQHAIVLLVHLIILLSCHAVKQSAARSVNYSEMDRQALLSFKASISSDPVGVLHSWSTSSLDFCNWSGVRCGMTHPLRVTSLDLNSRQLNGNLSSSLANLTSITQLDLSNNQLLGSIPKELGTGSKSLRVVNLAFNSLAGGIPHSLASSSSLTVLNLTNNLFFGTIPASLFNGSSNLAIIDLRMNAFSGPIPNFYKMSALQILNLAQNNLSGSIPPSLGKVSSINLISLEMNNLEGSIPETLTSLANASKLQWISLDNNKLVGTPPPAPSLSRAAAHSLCVSLRRRRRLHPHRLQTLAAVRSFSLSLSLSRAASHSLRRRRRRSRCRIHPRRRQTLAAAAHVPALPDAAAGTAGGVEAGISCELFHSAVVVDGGAWVWAKGDGGRLGLGDESSAFVPRHNPNLSELRVLALGGTHSAALTASGEVFTWGYGGFGALGHYVYHRELLPRKVNGPWEGKISHIATRGAHTAAITDSGCDEGDHRLGLGSRGGPGAAGSLSVPSKPPWDLEIGDAFIIHYTYRCDYDMKGKLTHGKVAESRFDKRSYDRKPAAIQYGNGSVAGFFNEDSVTIGDLVVKDQIQTYSFSLLLKIAYYYFPGAVLNFLNNAHILDVLVIANNVIAQQEVQSEDPLMVHLCWFGSTTCHGLLILAWRLLGPRLVFSEVAVDVRAPSAYGSYLNVCRRLFIGHNNPHHAARASSNMKGHLPRAVGNLSVGLRQIHFGKNQLIDPIPVEIGNLVGVISLSLRGNKLSGQIPSTIGNLSQLSMDQIPIQILNGTSLYVSLDLSNNLLTGSIPPQIGALITLVVLDISFNKFSGEIPSSLGQCVSLLSLDLKHNMLNGSIPQLLGQLKSIVLLDLSQNMFVGQIPEFLVNFSFLNQLDLSNNYFEGPIPTGGIFQNSSAVILDGNTRLCSSSSYSIFGFPICPTTTLAKRKNNAHLLIIVIPPVTIVVLSFFFFMVTLLKGKQAHTTSCYKETMKKVSYVDILKATNWFSPVNKISSSHTGSIYIGSFLTECEVLRNTRHRNLVKAITVCSTVDLENNEFKAIVLEFMANGSLDMWVHPKLHQNSPKRGLSLGQMIRIAADVASALDYMHNQLTSPLTHCDLKPSNVLLDYDMTAIGDFGSAKFLNATLNAWLVSEEQSDISHLSMEWDTKSRPDVMCTVLECYCLKCSLE